MAFDTSQALSIQAARTIDVGRGNGSAGGDGITEITGNIFSDGLESGDFDSTVTAQGAGWDRPASTTISIVRNDQYVVCNDNGPITPPTGPISGRQWENSPMAPSSGIHAIRTRFAGNADPANDAMSEMRFKLGTFEPSEVWLSFDVRIPINFYHREASGSNNNKLLRLYGSSYTSGGKVGMEFRPDGSGGSYFYGMSDSDGNAMPANVTGNATFATVPGDRGKWQRIIFQVVSETSPLAGDGIINIWRQWEDETVLTKVLSATALKIQRGDGVVAGFNQGYLMGYANSGYDEDTEFLVDNFNISTETMI